MKKVFLAIFFLWIIPIGTIRADLVWEEIKKDGKQEQVKKFWLKANLMRIDLTGPAWSYYYNLENHCLIVLARDKNRFRFLDWKELNRALAEHNQIKRKMITEQKFLLEKSPKDFFWLDPFGLEPIFFCSELFKIRSTGKVKNFDSIRAVEYLLECGNQAQARVWSPILAEPIPDWERFKSELKWLAIDRYRFYYSLPVYPVLIQSPKEQNLSYEIKILSTDDIPLEIFLIPESAKPELELN